MRREGRERGGVKKRKGFLESMNRVCKLGREGLAKGKWKILGKVGRKCIKMRTFRLMHRNI